MPSAQLTPADRTGADDDHAAIPISVRTDACRMGVGRNDNGTKWMPVRAGCCQVAWLARTRERKARARPLHVGERQPGFGEALSSGREHGGKALFDPEAKVCGTRNSFPQRTDSGTVEARPAPGAAAVNAEKKVVFLHRRTHIFVMENARELKKVGRVL